MGKRKACCRNLEFPELGDWGCKTEVGVAGPEVVGLGAAGLRASAHKASASRDVGASRGLKQEAREEAGVMAPQTETARGRELGCAVAEG